MTIVALTPAQARHDDFQGAHSIGNVVHFNGAVTPNCGAYADNFVIEVAMTGRNRAPQAGYVGRHRRVTLTKPVNLAKRAPAAPRVDLRKRYADLRTGKVSLYKVVLSKGVKG